VRHGDRVNYLPSGAEIACFTCFQILLTPLDRVVVNRRDQLRLLRQWSKFCFPPPALLQPNSQKKATMSRVGMPFYFSHGITFASTSFVVCILSRTVQAASKSSPESITDAVWASKNPKQRHQAAIIQWMVLSCSILSLLSCLVVLVWFHRMEKRFRHR
jgi:hypothetical protein